VSRSLILTANFAASDRDFPVAFLNSLGWSQVDADVVLIANHGGPAAEERLKSLCPQARLWVPMANQFNRIQRRIALTFPAPSRWLASRWRDIWRHRPDRRTEIERRAVYLLNITIARYLFAKHYLDQVASQYDHVLICDSRDVILQRDPFADLPPGIIVTGEESGRGKDHADNCYWMNHLYGNEPSVSAAALLEQKVICSGVTLGDTAAMQRYLEAMCAEFMERLPQLVHQIYMDQAVHIQLIRTGHLKGVQLSPNGDDRIATLATSDLSEFTIAPSGALLARDGAKVAIVHQYDRHRGFSDRLLASLHSKNEITAA